MKASVMLEHEEKYTIILAFDVKIERDAQEMADNMGVKIFQVYNPQPNPVQSLKITNGHIFRVILAKLDLLLFCRRT